MKTLLTYFITTLLAFFSVWILAVAAMNFSLLSPVAQAVREFSMTDVYYHVMSESQPTDTSRLITIVDMTYVEGRRKLARAMEAIMEQQPKVMGVDILFEGHRNDTLADRHITDIAQKYPNMVFSEKLFQYIDEDTGYAELCQPFFTDSIEGLHMGYANIERSLYSEIKRKLSIGQRVQGVVRPSFVTSVMNAYADSIAVPVVQRDLNINFTPTIFPVIDASDIEQNAELLKGRIVLLGAAHDETDTHYTPLGRMSGVRLMAYSLQTLAGQHEVRPMPTWLKAILSFLLVLVTQILLIHYQQWAKSRKSKIMSFFLTSTFIVGLLIFSWMAFRVWGGFMLFQFFHVSMNLGWALAAIPLLDGSREFSNIIYKQFSK